MNQNYNKYQEATNINKLFSFNNTTISDLDDKYEVRLFQDELIKKLDPKGEKYIK
ncbi:hypothetical protein ACFLY2_01285 [Patescibacteria group bacterium]